jgi:Zn-dependent peptidase ImmA (M78 family)
MNIKLINSKVNIILRGIPDLKPPIDIEKIAKSRGLKLVSYPLGDDVSGLLSIKDGTIGYNQKESPVRKRFTIAHELAHFELHRDKSDLFVDKQFLFRGKNSRDTPASQVLEQEANAFASAILMPTDLVKREVEKIEMDLGSEEAIKELARIFGVSTTAMSLRISGLGLF